MGIESQMVHTCVIERDEGTAEDKFGGPGTPEIVTVYEGICRLVEKQQRILNSENAHWTSVTVYKLFLPANTTVQERDLIASVTVDGNVTLEDAFRVKQFLNRRSKINQFVSVDLERIA